MGGKGKKKGKKGKKEADGGAAEGGGGGGEEEGGENGEGNGNGKKGKKGKKGKAGKSSKFQGDILSEAAMENAYYVCHNLMDLLKVLQFSLTSKIINDFSYFLGSRIRMAKRSEKEEERKEINSTFYSILYQKFSSQKKFQSNFSKLPINS